jgi:hypothetical protein
MSTLTFTRSNHRFFDELVAMLSALSSFSLTMDVINQGPINVLDPVHLGGCVIQNDLGFHPDKYLPVIAKNGWPTEIELHEEPRGSGMPVKVAFTLDTAGVQGLASIIFQGGFIRYYEMLLSNVKAQFTDDRKKWPPIWNFGRVIRNAFAHGGKIYFEKPTSLPSGTWNGLSYSYADNGRQIMYQDVAYVEIIYLMQEMDAVVV